MNSKRILGYVFVLLAIVLTFAILGQLPSLLGTILGFFRIITGVLDSYHLGKIIGQLIYWIIYIAGTFLLWIYGLRWIKKTR